MPTQINAVANPIINSPYQEPKQHWHIEEGKQPRLDPGRRQSDAYRGFARRGKRRRISQLRIAAMG